MSLHVPHHFTSFPHLHQRRSTHHQPTMPSMPDAGDRISQQGAQGLDQSLDERESEPSALEHLLDVTRTTMQQAIDLVNNHLITDDQLSAHSRYLPGSTIGSFRYRCLLHGCVLIFMCRQTSPACSRSLHASGGLYGHPETPYSVLRCTHEESAHGDLA